MIQFLEQAQLLIVNDARYSQFYRQDGIKIVSVRFIILRTPYYVVWDAIQTLIVCFTESYAKGVSQSDSY